ncbi:MAG: DUF4446 family protein [Candidatus Beckwithbacteria bacterium]|nr:DUF4446 family protein [Candidatus Beckwithbacteria bacterium]
MILNSVILQYLVLFLFLWVIVLTVLLVRSLLHYNRLTKKITKKDLKTVLSQLLDKVELNEKEIAILNQELIKVKVNLKSTFQKIGFVRFNPFSQTGGDQSFCLALLDENDNGLVLSSLHSREATRLYAKTIKNKQAENYELSKEELKAIQNAK